VSSRVLADRHPARFPRSCVGRAGDRWNATRNPLVCPEPAGSYACRSTPLVLMRKRAMVRLTLCFWAMAAASAPA